MSLYPIVRWDVITTDNVTLRPVVYIQPDLNFLEFAKANNFAIICEISGTNTRYDGVQAHGVVDKSCSVPNCRPNFYNKTGLYVITLDTTWYTYPQWDKLGFVKIFGFEKPKEMPINKDIDNVYELPSTLQMNDETLKQAQKMFKVTPDTKIAGFLILALLLVVLFVYLLKKK